MVQSVVVIGGGIAGVSAAAFISERNGAAVTLVEQETTLAHHTTGRSAAQWIQNYGHPAIRFLTKASFDFFKTPREGLTDAPLLHERAVLMVGTAEQEGAFEQVLQEGRESVPPSRLVTAAEAGAMNPAVDPDATAFALIEEGSYDVDVAATHQAFVRMLRRNGGTIRTSLRVDSALQDAGGWRVATTSGTIRADYLINAAGAWGDLVARTAGIEPVGLEPRRRTAFMVNASSLPGADMQRSGEWPMLINVAHNWYVKPDGAQFLCSPADQTPSVPTDARPEETDIAKAIDVINAETRLQIRSVASSWAGLRTFVDDESMVLGPDPANERFIWCVGQGGTGIQTSPATGELTAFLTFGAPLSEEYAGIDLDALLPQRLR